MTGKRPQSDMDREVYFEFFAVGGSVKVNAIDPVSGVEASIVGPSNAAQADLQRLALAKLKRMVQKKMGEA